VSHCWVSARRPIPRGRRRGRPRPATRSRFAGPGRAAPVAYSVKPQQVVGGHGVSRAGCLASSSLSEVRILSGAYARRPRGAGLRCFWGRSACLRSVREYQQRVSKGRLRSVEATRPCFSSADPRAGQADGPMSRSGVPMRRRNSASVGSRGLSRSIDPRRATISALFARRSGAPRRHCSKVIVCVFIAVLESTRHGAQFGRSRAVRRCSAGRRRWLQYLAGTRMATLVMAGFSPTGAAASTADSPVEPGAIGAARCTPSVV
jgi:hypothetical protein